MTFQLMKLNSEPKFNYMETLLSIQSIDKQFDKYKALDDVSIEIPKGSIFGLLGPNGAGKTTLIRIINQITGPDRGKVLFKGEPLNPNHVSTIGYLPEERGLYKKMTVGEQALYLAQLKGVPAKIAQERLRYWFHKFEIETWWKKKIEELSKGMQQKIQFITTIIHEPELLIFDEPFSGFDPINANLLKNEILDLSKRGSTIIFSTHNMASVEEMCDNIALINKGRKVLDGKVTDIRSQYRTSRFEIGFDGAFDKIAAAMSSAYTIEEIFNEHHLVKVRVKLSPNATTADVLSHMLKAGNIHSFNEMIPSMNEIFIQVVGGSNAPVANSVSFTE